MNRPRNSPMGVWNRPYRFPPVVRYSLKNSAHKQGVSRERSARTALQLGHSGYFQMFPKFSCTSHGPRSNSTCSRSTSISFR